MTDSLLAAVPPDEMRRRVSLLAPRDKARLLSALRMKARGYRSNRYIDAIRPKVHPKQAEFLASDQLELMYGGSAGGGKVLYDDGQILTPFGFKAGRDVEVGDRVNNPDGSIARIIQVHPRAEYRVWRVTFHDGAYTDVAEQHLWLAWRAGKSAKRSGVRVFGQDSAEVIETRQLKEWCDAAKDRESRGERALWPCIPVCQPQRFNVQRRFKCGIDAYLLGAWLGNGHVAASGSVGITSADIEHTRAMLTKAGAEWSEHQKPEQDMPCLSFLFRGEYRQGFLRRLGVVGLDMSVCETKFIPDEYLLGDIETRTAIFQGLMDTDGYADTRGQLYFTSVSERLVDGVRFIVRSLGGTATKTSDIGSYRTSEGIKVNCQQAFTLYIKLPDERIAFRLERKRSRCQPDGSYMLRRVVSVDILDEKRFGRCITVSHPNGLYITNDFIVTHNSDALLLGALQYVDVKGYSAIIFRRTLTDLALPGALMHRAKEWLAKFNDVRWNGTERAFYFPEGGQLTFGYLDSPEQIERYRSAEFQYIGFDELTEHPEENYRYMFSRLRRVKGMLVPVPIRMRSATNPGGRYGPWVQKRFISEEYLLASVAERFSRIWKVDVQCEDCDGTGGGEDGCPFCDGNGAVSRYFLPAKIDDNPTLDKSEYLRSLREQTFVNRARLLDGDWTVQEEGNLFRASWFRYYGRVGEHFVIYPQAADGTPLPQVVIARERIIYFVTADTASKEHNHNDPTVICRWAYDTRDHHLFLLGGVRERMEIPKIAPTIMAEARRCGASFVLIEEASSGIAVIQLLRGAVGQGIAVKNFMPGTADKVSRSTQAQIRVEGGQVWFPQGDDRFVQESLSELVQFPGGLHDDFVDNLSMACWYVSQQYRMSGGGTGGAVAVVASGPFLRRG